MEGDSLTADHLPDQLGEIERELGGIIEEWEEAELIGGEAVEHGSLN